MATTSDRKGGAQDEPRFFTYKTLGDRWGVSRTTLHREVERGRLKKLLVAGSVRFSRDEVHRYEGIGGS